MNQKCEQETTCNHCITNQVTQALEELETLKHVNKQNRWTMICTIPFLLLAAIKAPDAIFAILAYLSLIAVTGGAIYSKVLPGK